MHRTSQVKNTQNITGVTAAEPANVLAIYCTDFNVQQLEQMSPSPLHEALNTLQGLQQQFSLQHLCRLSGTSVNSPQNT